MKLFLVGLFLLSSAYAQFDFGNDGANGPIIGCFDEHKKEGLAGMKLCLKAQENFMLDANVNHSMKAFHEIMVGAIADLPAKGKKVTGTAAKTAFTKAVQQFRIDVKAVTEIYKNELRLAVTSSKSARSLYSSCTSENRAERFLSNSCTNLAQKVGTLILNKMKELYFGHNLAKEVSEAYRQLTSDIDFVVGMDKRFAPLSKMVSSEYWIIDRAADEASEEIVKANVPFSDFTNKYDGISYSHKTTVLRELVDLGIKF